DLFAQRAASLLVAGADLFAQRAASLLVADADLLPDGRKLLAHLVSKLRNLQRQRIDAGRKLFENSHARFEAFYSCFNGLRSHRSLQFCTDAGERAPLTRRRSASVVPPMTVASSACAGNRPNAVLRRLFG